MPQGKESISPGNDQESGLCGFLIFDLVASFLFIGVSSEIWRWAYRRQFTEENSSLFFIKRSATDIAVSFWEAGPESTRPDSRFHILPEAEFTGSETRITNSRNLGEKKMVPRISYCEKSPLPEWDKGHKEGQPKAKGEEECDFYGFMSAQIPPAVILLY